MHFNRSNNTIKKSQSIVFQLIEIYKAEEEGLFEITRIHCFQDLSEGEILTDTERDTALT